jgi:hypothetical protein
MMGTLLDTAMQELYCITSKFYPPVQLVQWQAGVVLFGHGICLHFDPPCITEFSMDICIIILLVINYY